MINSIRGLGGGGGGGGDREKVEKLVAIAVCIAGFTILGTIPSGCAYIYFPNLVLKLTSM